MDQNQEENNNNFEDIEPPEIQPKQKKELSQKQIEHLNNIRVKALEKKKEMKKITEKSSKLKEI